MFFPALSHLPITFYGSFNDIPPYNDYAMKGRTYRYFNGKLQFPFGFGMSYTHFEYEWINLPVTVKGSISFSVKVKNVGKYDRDELIQAYVHYPKLPDMPVKELKAFRRLPLKINGNGIATFSIPVSEFKKWDRASHSWVLYPGDYKIVVGSNSDDEKLFFMLNLGKKQKK